MPACPGPFVPIPGAAVSEFGSRSWSRAPDGLNIEGTNRVSQWPRGYGETSPGAPAGIAFRSACRAGLMCLLTSRLGDACLLHPGPVAVPHAVRRKPGQYLAASSPRHCVRPGLRRGDGRCGDEMTGACESHSSNGRARRHNRHLTLRRKGSEERAEGSFDARTEHWGGGASVCQNRPICMSAQPTTNIRSCVFSELPGVAAAQNPKRPRRSTATLTGMSLSVGRDVRWPAPRSHSKRTSGA